MAITVKYPFSVTRSLEAVNCFEFASRTLYDNLWETLKDCFPTMTRRGTPRDMRITWISSHGGVVNDQQGWDRVVQAAQCAGVTLYVDLRCPPECL